MANAGFLSEFPAVSTADWESAILETVPGSDYKSKLIWHPEEGLAVKPYYRAEDLSELSFLTAAPGDFPYVRSARTTADWRIRETVETASAEEANRCAIDAVAAGADEIEFCGVSIESSGDLALLLANLRQIPVRFCGLDRQAVRIAADWLRAHPHSATVSADVDPLIDVSFTAELSRVLPGHQLFTISAERYEERGAGSIEQVAFALSAAVEFLNTMLELGMNIDEAAKMLGFSFAIGPQYFTQIAKLRAFRLAWARVVESFGGNRAAARPTIFARGARWNETIYDPEVNTLRATTEAISAVLGGVDSLALSSFDRCYREPSQASRRLARNVQLILKREGEFARVADPLGGAYAIEALTSDVATKAWKMFQELEAEGGYRKAQADGFIESIVQRRATDRDVSISHRRLALVGTNRLADPGETALDRVDASQTNQIPRAAQDFESIRLRTERAATIGSPAGILLAEFGDAKISSIRAHFVKEFLSCAGLMGEARRVRSPLDVAGSDARLIVLCSTDSEYLAFAEELLTLLAERKSRARIVVAGYPENAEELKRLGVTESIHLRSNAVEVLTRLQQTLAVEG
ncbi:MAG: hypothetical protein JST28_12560 [Acidobacteria bacterium]|nr:hypothetical protein [Acidobacteriota bacterium]